jgi:hypothetical protein
VNVTNRFYAYRIYLSPATVTDLEDSEVAGMLLYPNPFHSDGLTISLKGNFHYQITDLKGTVLEEGLGKDVRMAGTNLEAGTYLLSVEASEGKHVRKIFKH